MHMARLPTPGHLAAQQPASLKIPFHFERPLSTLLETG